MSLQPGTTLGVYSVTAKIGEGGMGEVYPARDTKLDRDVALKVLPEAFTSDPDRLARFEREAKVLASLNHPNIGTIYGLEEAEGVKALVLELIEGPTLADRIRQGPIPIDEALPIAKQIAEALEAAHEAGVIHRDLKPANIKVREEGTVKVLDFGLAKAVAGDSPNQDLSQSPTMTASVGGTREGVILGTAAYMSPEQARGKSVDRRTDIWAFGCVLFEMLTGKAVFAGDSLSDTIAAVLTADVDLDALPTDAPSGIRRLLRRCLDREPKRRLRDVADGLLELDEDPSERSAEAEASATARPQSSLAHRMVPVLVAVAVTGIVTGFAVWQLRPSPQPPARDLLTVTFPEGVRLVGLGRRFAALSPDGRDLVYVAEQDGRTRFYHRPLDQAEAEPVADTEGAGRPFFSPDGASVGFMVGNQIRRVSLAGGGSRAVAQNADTDSLGWSDDDTIWFSEAGSLHRVPASGGTPQRVTTPGTEDATRRYLGPQPIPGSGGILYTGYRGILTPLVIGVYDSETDEHRVLAEGSGPSFASSGHVVFSRESDLWALPFDVDRLVATGDAVLVREGVRAGGYEGGGGRVNQAFVDRDGSLVYVPAGGTPDDRTLVWVSRSGTEKPVVGAPPRPYLRPQVSPDGTRVVVVIDDDLWIHDLRSGQQRALASHPGVDSAPLWTPDGNQIFFSSDRDRGPNEYSVFRTLANGAGTAELFHSDPERSIYPYSWSEDGRTLVVMGSSFTGPGGFDIGTMAMEGEQRWVPLLRVSKLYPEVSPDGQLLAYLSQDSETCTREMYVQPFPNVDDDRWSIASCAGGYHHEFVWSVDGGELLYRVRERTGEGQPAMMAVAIDPQRSSAVGAPDVLFEDRYFTHDIGRQFDLAPDGRFLMIKDADSAPARQINVVRNWVEELVERVPVP